MGRVGMAETIVRIRNGRTIPLPAWAVRSIGNGNGGFVRVRQTPAGILLKPATSASPGQAWFWTKRWQKMEMEVDADIRKGRIRRSSGLKELLKNLKG